MGAHVSADGSLRARLQEPLLSHRADAWTPCAPPSFKAGKPRKTQDFIMSEQMQREEGRYSGDIPPDVDPRLLDDTDTVPITTKVASLIYQYLEEGNAAMVIAPDPMGDEFHEAHFLRRHCCVCWPRRASTPSVSVDSIFSLISDVAASLYFCKQVVVICAIYVERLLNHETDVVLTTSNWRSIVVAGLLTASKVWEDVHPWNIDFEKCLYEKTGLRYKQGALYRLESIFLDRLQWQVFVDGEEYAAYFFSLLEGSQMPTNKQPKLHRNASDSFRIDTIMEYEIYSPGGKQEFGSDAWYAAAPPPPASPTLMQLPWSREDLAAGWKRDLLEAPSGGDACSLGCSKARTIHDTWKLDKTNPYIGALRHAPRALAPSARIPQSTDLLWAHEMVSRTAQIFGTPTPSRWAGSTPEDEGGTAHTLSGATGAGLASELLRYFDTQLTNGRGADSGSGVP